MLTVMVPLQAILDATPGRGMLLLPAQVEPAAVASHRDDLRVYSGPTAGAEDYGPAGPAFTLFTVLGPQVAQRLFVLNPATGAYGWVDVAGLGPVAGTAPELAAHLPAIPPTAAALPGPGGLIPIPT